MIEYRDNAGGIPDEVIGRIFEPFARGSAVQMMMAHIADPPPPLDVPGLSVAFKELVESLLVERLLLQQRRALVRRRTIFGFTGALMGTVLAVSLMSTKYYQSSAVLEISPKAPVVLDVESGNTVADTQTRLATAYEPTHGPLARVHQFALVYLFTPSTDLYSCPLAMTDGAARTLIDAGEIALVERAVPRLTSRDPALFWTSGQWMTEATGGSDVGLSRTVAKKTEAGWELHGRKWFTSAIASQMALTLPFVQPGRRNLINTSGTRVRLPVKGREGLVAPQRARGRICCPRRGQRGHLLPLFLRQERGLRRAGPQHAFPHPAVLHLLRPAVARHSNVGADGGQPRHDRQSRRL